MKRCPRCEETKPVDGFHKNKVKKDGLGDQCKACVSAYSKKRYKENPDYHRKIRLSRYGITPEAYDEMWAQQNGLCAICGEPEQDEHHANGQTQKLAVDHNHETGAVRSLLCARCNKGPATSRSTAPTIRSGSAPRRAATTSNGSRDGRQP